MTGDFQSDDTRTTKSDEAEALKLAKWVVELGDSRQPMNYITNSGIRLLARAVVAAQPSLSGDSDTAQKLAELSAAATPGPISLNRQNRLRVLTSMDHPMCEFSDPYHRQSERGEGADPEFMVALWNAYRAEQLVPRDTLDKATKALADAMSCMERANAAFRERLAIPSARCGFCAPEFGCFDGSKPCCKASSEGERALFASVADSSTERKCQHPSLCNVEGCNGSCDKLFAPVASSRAENVPTVADMEEIRGFFSSINAGVLVQSNAHSGLARCDKIIDALRRAPSATAESVEMKSFRWSIENQRDAFRNALIEIRDECANGAAYDIAVRALTPPEGGRK
jgi:hypothetical protein